MTTLSSTDLVAGVRRLAAGRLRRIASSVGGTGNVMPLLSGKMLRTRLAARLAPALPGRFLSGWWAALARACAATELIHAASLCHDDLIDAGLVRRGRPTLWRAAGPTCAILIGDVLIFEAFHLLLDAGDGRYAKSFASKIREMCAAEVEQELELRGKPLDIPTCLRIARGKTGPLFAFVGQVCGGDDAALSEALEESGYLVGTAYQLADDLLDVVGEERVAGKTLGLDAVQLKYTLPQFSENAPGVTQEHISDLLGAALDSLEAWPRVRSALAEFLHQDLRPLFEKQLGLAGLPVGVANATEGWP